MAASPTWSTNQSVSLWDELPQKQQQSFFGESKHSHRGGASNSSCGDSNGDSLGALTSHDWESGSESSDDDEAQDQRSLLARVAHLISRLLDDERFESEDSSDNNPEEIDEDDDHKDGKPPSRTKYLDSSLSREKFLETKLAQVLIELSAEQENLQFAASAGKELLEQLSEVKDDNHELRSQLYACQQQLVLVETEKARLQQQQSAMERELMQIHESWTESQPKSSSRSSRGRGDYAPWAKTAAVEEIDPDSCQLCPRSTADLKSVLEENNELKRRCLELENQQSKQRAGFGELQQKHEALQATLKKVEVHSSQSQRDVEYVNAQLKQLKLDHQDAATSRDNLRATARRLQSENDNLVQKLEDRDALVTFLQNEKRAAGTTAQILENRVSSMQLENQTLMLALAESHQHQQDAERLRQIHDLQIDDQCSEGTISLQQHARDLENLLDEAQCALVALKLENKILRRQQQSGGVQTVHVAATFRRAKSMTMTCADIFAADEVMPQSRDAGVDNANHNHQLQSLGSQQEGLKDVISELTPHQTRLARFEAAAVSPIQGTAAVSIGAAPAPLPQGATPTFLQSVATRRRHTYADNNGEKQSIREQERMRRSTVTASAEIQETSDDQMASAKSPLYLGLSVIACATAAAGILSRR